ncbi:hypothetical protein [Mucilaginibacter sp. SP1R1]|uniref:hypothetical protein n=1 Tax=Mucilaginibacter sp. SP1R1 TaxID=2723091 RepID=UPI00160759E9|nr:hypothetical protein [Mucilaginibacter sp. SP1R1]MBB6149776.1 hypothetical protein [Mucilaginibacter sp. SP1R1]
MLNQQQLIKEISATIGKTKVVELSRILKKEQFSLYNLIDITFNPDPHIAFRAAWILENIFLTKPESYVNEMEYLISRFKEIDNPSCMRHYTKIVMHITDIKAPETIKQKLQTINLEPVIEQLFDWMINPKIKVAVKVFAGRALFNLKDLRPWIAEELAGQLQYLMRDGSAGIQSRGKKILKRL